MQGNHLAMSKPFSLRRNNRFGGRNFAIESLEERLVPAGMIGDGAPVVDFSIANKWTGGFQGDVAIKNDEATAMNDWTVEFDAPFQISSVWNAQIVSHTGNHYVIKNGGWNGNIAAGDSANFGFQSSSDASVGSATNVVFSTASPTPPNNGGSSSATASVNYKVSSDWGSGFNADMTIKNTGTSAINGWTLEFDSPIQIGNIWNATIVSHTGNHYVIKNAGHNGTIAAGQSVSFGFQGSGGSANVPTAYKLNGTALDGTTPPAPVVPSITVNDLSLNEGNSGTSAAGFVVKLSQATTSTVTVQYATANGTSSASSDYTANSGTITFAPGETQKTININVLGDAAVESDETFLLKLSNPSGATIADSEATGTIRNDDVAAPVLPTVSVGNVSIAEGNSGTTAASFAVSLSAASASAVTVNYSTVNGTAAAGSDYAAKTGTVTFAPGETQKTISIDVSGDTSVESDETYIVRLANASGATIATADGTGTIRNDDTAPVLPTLSIAGVTVTEGNSGSTNAAFLVTLSAASTSAVTVNYSTANGTATAGSDYTAASGALTFAPGETQKTVTVAVVGDTATESTETYTVGLASASGATIATASATGTIIDNDTVQNGAYNYDEVLQKSLYFYGAQRSGDLPDDFFVDWRGDSALSDGSDVGIDLSGGYYDAGDHVKFELPMASSMTMLTWGLLQYKEGYVQSGQLDEMLDALRWGADWIIKAHPSPNVLYVQVGDGGADHSFWGAPELMTMARPSYKIDAQHPGSDAAGEAAAFMAAASMAFKDVDPAYSAVLLQHAKDLFKFADTYRGKYSDSVPAAAQFYNSYSGYQDELVWGATWLYKATGDQTYLAKAESIYKAEFAGDTMTWTQSWDDKAYGAAILLSQITNNQIYKTDVEKWLDYWTVGINGGSNRIKYTPGGLAVLDTWGALRYSANTSFLAFIYSDTVNDHNGRYHDFAVKQINYMLGDNPQQRSYVVGFGNNPPVNAHHRGASGVWDGNHANPTPNRNILYGALVGGPKTASDSDYQDVRTDYISNEVALDYNAGFQGAIARMVMQYGGTPLANPFPQTADQEYFVEASINNQGTGFTEISAYLNNRSDAPARAASDLSYHYFVNLSEVYSAGYTVSDVNVTSNYNNGAKVSQLTAYDAANHIYYVNIDFTGITISPGSSNFRKEAQFRVSLRQGLPGSAWDPTNDWSFQGLTTNKSSPIVSNYIPVYEAGSVLLFGQLPPAGGGNGGGGGGTTPSQPALSVADVSITEGNSGSKTAAFAVTLNKASTEAVTVAYTTVAYTTVAGTATAGTDFQSTSGTLTFAAGTTSLTVSVAIAGDGVVEGNESFQLALSNPTNAQLARDKAIATIVDDDAPPVVTGVNFKVNDDWGAGFVGQISITNGGASTVNGWTLEFDFDRNITSIWNATIVSHVGNHYVIKPVSWNSTIPAGGSISFGFQGETGNVKNGPTNILLNGAPIAQAAALAAQTSSTEEDAIDALMAEDPLLMLV